MEKSANWEIHKELKTQHHEEADRISDLPDHVLLHAISLLPIQSAVATCILSKRWKDVWTGIKTLDLTDCSKRLKSSEDYTSFKLFLDKVRLSKDAPCLHLVKFYISGEIDRIHASEWVTSLMKHRIRMLELNNKVEKLWLYEDIDKLILLPANFFISHELVELKLCGDLIIRFPASLHFPLLKIGCLSNIHFLDGGSVRNLLSGSPILEELLIEDCEGEGSLDLHSSSMKRLNITYPYWTGNNIAINAPNLEELYLMQLPTSCVITTPNLRHLTLNMLYVDNYSIDYMPSLEDVYLDIGGYERKVAETLHKVRSSKSLTLEVVTLSLLQRNYQGLPVFSNLTRLEVKMYSWPIILHLLELSPNLKYFVASFGNSGPKLEWFCPASAPDCMHVLEDVQIREFDRGKFVSEMIQYILMEAKFLKKMEVKVCQGLKHKIKKIIEALEMTPKVSFACEVIVS